MLRYVINYTLNTKFNPQTLLVPQYCYPRINTGHMVSVLAPLKGTDKQVGHIDTQKPK